MSEEIVKNDRVERIVDKDPKALKAFFLAFFLLFPISGILIFWFDGHAKLERESKEFAQGTVIPLMKDWNELEIMGLGTTEFAEDVRAGRLKPLEEEVGDLKAFGEVDADKTRAREEDDQGVIYAEIDFDGKFEKKDGRVHMIVTRLSLNQDWMIESIEIKPKVGVAKVVSE